MKTKIFIAIMALMVVTSVTFAAPVYIAATRHNLASSSGNTTRDSAVDQICVHCHTPHSALAKTTASPLWNKTLSVSVFTNYGATQARTAPTYNLAGSGLCFSCHDGATSLNTLVNNPGAGTGTAPTFIGNVNASGYLTGYAVTPTNLTTTHPVGINYDTSVAGMHLKTYTLPGTWISTGTTVQSLLDTISGTDYLNCGGCHSVHRGDYTPFLRSTMTGSNLCYGCHNK